MHLHEWTTHELEVDHPPPTVLNQTLCTIESNYHIITPASCHVRVAWYSFTNPKVIGMHMLNSKPNF